MSVFLITTEQGHKVARPVTSRDEYLRLRGSSAQLANLRLARQGSQAAKRRLVQMNYSCLPAADGLLRGAHTPSTTVGMDVDFDPTAPDYDRLMATAPETILAKKDELGLLMLERSATKGYHIVFARRAELSNEANLQWASDLLGVAFDRGAKDLTRVFFTTSASADDLLFLDDRLFAIEACENQEHAAHAEQTITPTAPTEQPITTAAQTSSPATQTAQPSSPSYKGLPYSRIIGCWMALTGGQPTQGERNMRLYQLAASLRAICDNDPQLLLTVMPTCGLPDTEMRAIVQSACREQPKGLTRTLRAAIDKARQADGDDYETAPAAEAATAPQPARPPFASLTMPPALQATLDGVPQDMQWPVIAAVMPLAAAYADGVELEYCDGVRQRLGLMSIVLGEQASGKSTCKKAVDLWKRQLDREDQEARRREDEWKAKKRGRKANEKLPDDPQVLIRMVPVTVSCSTLLKRFKNSRGHTLYSFGEELDTLRKTNGAGSWSSKYDIYRLAFDHGEWGQDYNSDQAESGVVNVAYNWTMLGTYGAMSRCFKADNIENGLSSRVIVADMPDNSFAPMPHFATRSALDEQLIDEGATRLRQATGFVDTPRLRQAIADWVERKRLEAAKDIDHVKDTYRKRAAVIAFRCGAVFHLLTGQDEESPEAVGFALEVADLTLQGQMRTFGDQLDKQYVSAESQSTRRGCNVSVFDRLPPVFTQADLQELKGGRYSPGSLRAILSRWKAQGWLEKIDAQHWRKVAQADSE